MCGRRWSLGRWAGLLISFTTAGAVEKVQITLEHVARIAEERARKPFKSPRGQLPESMSVEKLNYDKYREIRFNRDQALWRKEALPFWVEFFHPGYIYQEPVQMHEFTSEGYTQAIRFAPDFYDYSRVPGVRETIPVNAGYAGFKLLYALNKAEVMDELAVFQGASYFRMLGKESRYGQSARGLAVNCGEGEEFPLFTDFWLGKPQAGASELRLYAILDSRSCTGAYQFTLRPGGWTRCDIEAVLFFRPEEMVKVTYESERIPYAGLKTVGLAPLTSMFWFGENTEGKPDDYRGEVHDSDGLLIQMGNDELVWRPLVNPPVKDAIRHSVFGANNPKFFGLLQRDRDYRNYHEVNNFYHKVPTMVVRPRGAWGEGQVRLIEIGTVNEYADNIVAFWNPAARPEPMRPFRFGYSLESGAGAEPSLSSSYVAATRLGAAPENTRMREVVIDFTGPALEKLPESERLEAIPSCPPGLGHFSKAMVVKNPLENSWRAFLKFEPAADLKDPVNMRCTLKKGGTVLTETWDYLWNPR